MNENLSNIEEEDLTMLIRSSESLLETYLELIELEKEGKKQTEEYKNVVKRLIISKSLESNILKRFNKNMETIKKVRLILERMLGENEDALKIMINNKKRDIVIIRLLNIYGLLLLDYVDEKIKSKEALISSQLVKSIQKDVNSAFLLILEKSINSPLNKDLKLDLIKSKYYKIFMSYIDETRYIENNFEIEDKVYTESYFCASLYKMSDQKLKERINLFTNIIYKFELSTLVKESKKPKSALELMLRKISLRSIFIFFTEEELALANERFHEYIDDNKELYPIEKNLDTICEAFKSYKLDSKCLIKTTLKR